MTTIAQRPATARPFRRTALVAGLLYLLTFAASIPAALLLAPVLADPGYILGGGSEGRVLLACLLDLVNAFACVGTAVALFPVMKRQNEGLALGFVASRMVEATVILIGIMCLLAVVTLRQAQAGSTDEAALVVIGRALVAVRNWTFLLGPTLMPAINALLLASLLFRSRLVPRFIPLLGLIGGPLLLVSTLLTYFGATAQVSPVSVIATVPIFLWELLLGLWLTFTGFRPAPITGDGRPRMPAR